VATITFDTLKYVEHLREAGISESQAKAFSDAQKELLAEVFDQKELATKTDIKELELKIAETKAELIRWVVAAGFLQTVLIAALLMKLIK
jgi:hypothetical protein